MTCLACGQALALPARNPGLQLKRRDPPRPREQAVPANVPGSADNIPDLSALVARRSASLARDIHWVQANTLRVWLSALIFLVLAGGGAYIRFYSGWPGIPLETLKWYGMLAVAAAYLFIIGLALRDNMFDGLLAIMVPLYPFYYLFLSANALFTRALVGALLVAFGYDTLLFLQGWAAGVIGAVKLWIRSV
ncbi:MAG: hypothetical protein ABIH24_05495 [Verrucomicrobiota bacterium]